MSGVAIMLIQVVMPTFNASTYFAEALESIAGNPDSEILVIDDGSHDHERDAVAAMCSRYSDVRFFSRPHRGFVKTANFGLSIATAPFVARMDADDVSLPGRLERQLAFLIANPDIAAVGAQVEYVDAKAASTGRVSNLPCDPDQIAKHLFTTGCCINHPTVLARRQSLLDIGGYRVIGECAEDYDLWLRLSEQSRLANLPDILLRYRRHDAQVSVRAKWRQRFARDLALISARARRQGKDDPLAGLDMPLDWKLDDARFPTELKNHLNAYKAIDKVLESRWNDLSKMDMQLLIDAASLGLLGDDRRVRATIMCIVSRLALKAKYIHEFYDAMKYTLSHRPLWAIEAFANPDKSLDRLRSL